nr:MAG TPA: hypothetical protein [Caudoviricetes sp.]
MTHQLTNNGTFTRVKNVLENTFNESECIDRFGELNPGDWVIIQLSNSSHRYHYRAGVVSERKDGGIEVKSGGHRILFKPGSEQRIRRCKLMK